MGFNWKAFTAAFLDKQTEGIRERRKEAKDFEEEQKEAANRNAKLVSQRNLIAQDAAQIGAAAQELGATKEQVIAAMSSGSLGIKQFYEKLLKAANQKGVTTLGESDIEAIIDMPEVFEVNPEYIDGTLLDFAKQTYGAQTRSDMKKEPIQTSDSVMAQLFGFDAMNQAKKSLQDTEYMGGMSVADINELAAQQEYNSLFNDLGVNFFDKEFYGPQAASNLLKEVTDEAARAEVSSLTKAFAEREVDNWKAVRFDESLPDSERRTDETEASVKADATQYAVRERLEDIFKTALNMYGTTGILDHEPTLKLIRETMGDEFLQDETELIRRTENTLDSTEDSTDTLSDRELTQEGEELFAAKEQIREANKQFKPQEDPETQTPDTETQKTTLPPEETDDEFVPIPRPEGRAVLGISTDALNARTKGWDRKYAGKLDPVTGEKIMIDPRPDAGGPKDKEVEVVNQFGIRQPGKTKKVTAREEWDILYGETHNPDGSPKL